jgi:MFS-type transporter involved in bile tolerance (Atg22 family)
MPPYLLRLAYVSEFFLALIAVLTGWSQIGGQTHLDIMPWYDILILSVSLSLVAVMGTVAAVRHDKAWNFKSITCLIAALLIAAAMGAVTYYYHLHEDDGNDDSNTGTHALLCLPPIGRPV